MKSLLCTFILAVTCLGAFAQTPLTTAEVYDFQVGDEFERRTLAPIGPTFEKIVITNWSALGNTINYSYDYSITEYNGQTSFILTGTGSNSETISNISDTLFASYVPGLITPDTAWTSVRTEPNFNGRRINSLNESATSPVSAGTAVTDWGEGLGLVYFRALAPGDGIDEQVELTYYKKGTEIFGNLVVGIEGDLQAQDKEFLLYPNPTVETLCVKLVDNAEVDGLRYGIYDLAGRRVLEGDLPQDGRLDMQALPAGSWWLRIESGGSEVGFRFEKRTR